jgi:hypothetical protein
VPDYKLKPLKQFFRPYFSPNFNCWEIDIGFFNKKSYLFAININTKYLIVFPIERKKPNSYTIRMLLEKLISLVEVDEIRGDGDTTWAYGVDDVMLPINLIQEFCDEHEVRTYFTKSKFTNHNRVVDRVIRTIRDGLGAYNENVLNNNMIQTTVDYYNNSPHIAYQNVFTPAEVQENKEIEAQYIRYSKQKLEDVKKSQALEGLTSYQEGNILLIHLDLGKTQMKFTAQRRNFNHLAEFVTYKFGNVVCRLLKPLNNAKYVTVPVFYTKKISENLATLPIKYKNYFKTR